MFSPGNAPSAAPRSLADASLDEIILELKIRSASYHCCFIGEAAKHRFSADVYDIPYAVRDQIIDLDQSINILGATSLMFKGISYLERAQTRAREIVDSVPSP